LIVLTGKEALAVYQTYGRQAFLEVSSESYGSRGVYQIASAIKRILHGLGPLVRAKKVNLYGAWIMALTP
jgi:hypothetical protein